MNDNTAAQVFSPRLVPVEALNAISSLIAEGALFEGSFTAPKDMGLRIDGGLKGNVQVSQGGTIHVGPGGRVENTVIEADHVLIEGHVQGTVIARQTLEITGSATLVGDVFYDSQLDVHPRARLRGKVEFRGEVAGTAPAIA